MIDPDPPSAIGEDLGGRALSHRRLLSARVSAFLDQLRTAFPDGAPEELARYVEKG